MKKLLLWDIDGTLIWGGGGGERALVIAMDETFGIEADLTAIDYSGRTDKRIGEMLMQHYNIPITPERVHDFIESYLKHLAEQMPLGETLIHPGVLDILETMHAREDILQGLLTGNMVRGAQIKLEHFNLWHFFTFGGFADDSPIRNEIAPHAFRRGIEKAGYDFPPESVYVVGDTPHDIECGKIIGANTIAVATGTYNLQALEAHSPTAAFENFCDTDTFFRIIEETEDSA